MHYAQIRKFDIANGPGIRTSLFVSGCTHQCMGCFNEDYKKFNYGQPWTADVKASFIEHVNAPMIKGVTILGGEPFDQMRDDDLLELVQSIKAQTNKSIWIYSGYTFEQLASDPKRFEVLKQCDVLVDGPFVQALKDLKLRFRGSSNQRIINVSESIKNMQPVLLETY